MSLNAHPPCRLSQIRRGERLSPALLTVLMSLAACANGALAAEAPVWKFELRAKHRYTMTQHMAIAMDLGAGGKETQDVTNLIEMSWVVDKVNDDGSAAITQKIDRMKMTVAPPQGEKVEYDSDSTDEPQGFAAMVAPLFREMTRAEFTLTMSPRGKISDVHVPESLITAIAASPGAAAMGEMATAKGMQDTMSRMSFELPETLDPNAPWTITTELANPILGTQTIKITYQYVGPREADGATLEVFKPTLEIAFAGGAATSKVESQSTEGEVLFNRTAGRLESMSLIHKMALTLTTGGQTIKETLDQETEMKWVEEAAE